jgi:uncharacterized protein
VVDRVATVVWELRDEGAEICFLDRVASGSHRLSGTAILAAEGSPYFIEYAVGVDPEWRTRSVDVTCNDARIELTADGSGRWSRPGFEGCVDVDLGFTPATNTLPIRRVGLAVGEAADLDVTWLRFPELTIERMKQRYERLADDRFLYSSPGFAAELRVDEHGLVLEYEGLWRSIGRA